MTFLQKLLSCKTQANCSFCALWIYRIVILSWCCAFITNAELFSSVAGLQALASNERGLRDLLASQLEGQEHSDTLNIEIAKLSKTIDLEHGEILDEVNPPVFHPISALNLIKRWQRFLETCVNESAATNVLQEAAKGLGITLPESSDYQGAIGALVRLQKTYQLHTADIAAGIINNVSANQGMDDIDSLAMARTLYNIDHSLAMTWLDLLLENLENGPEVVNEVYQYKLLIHKTRVDLEGAVMAARELARINASIASELHTLEKEYDRQRPLGKNSAPNPYWKHPRDRNMERYEALCRGDNISNVIAVNKNLMCVYRRGILPYIRYKEEIHSFDPRISLFLEVISNDNAEMLKSKALPSLFRARVGDPGNRRVSEGRVGKLTWLYDTDAEVASMSTRVSDITGLETQYKEQYSNADAFQIVNYGIGGQYEEHHDFQEGHRLKNVPLFVRNMGDRISTFMFYLSDVTAGGATVFPLLGVRIPPIKNAAAFWYNFPLSETRGDVRTRHAGCPVLLGQKWVGNKWIRQAGQIFRRPCGLAIDQIDPIWST